MIDWDRPLTFPELVTALSLLIVGSLAALVALLVVIHALAPVAA